MQCIEIKPENPHVENIQGQFIPGKLLRIKGKTRRHCRGGFGINLQCGPSIKPSDDIALHIFIGFKHSMRLIIRNSLYAQKWGMKEELAGGPINVGEEFEILILCELTYYKIALNGFHFADFYERITYQRITHLAIVGDVLISLIRFENCCNRTPIPKLGCVTAVSLPGIPPNPTTRPINYPASRHRPVSRVIRKATNIITGAYRGAQQGAQMDTRACFHQGRYPTVNNPVEIGFACTGSLATGPVGKVYSKKEIKKQKKALRKNYRLGGPFRARENLSRRNLSQDYKSSSSTSSSSSSSSEEE